MINDRLLRASQLFHKIITAGEIIDLSKFKKLKEESNFKLDSLFKYMSIKPMIESGTITIDSMHAARKAAGFPPVEHNDPAWIHLIINAIDETDHVKRTNKFQQLTLHWGLLSKDPKVKAQAEEEKIQLENKSKHEFIKMAKRGWLRFEQFEDWKPQFI